MENNLVSIITPVYNAKNYIEDTINSVLNQTYTEWEMIMVDDGSTDGSAEFIEAFIYALNDPRLRIIKLPENKSAAYARNMGVEAAKGRYIAFIDSDDIWRCDKLKKEIEFISQNKVGFVFSDYEFGDESAKPTGKIVHVPDKLTFKKALTKTTIFTSTVMFDTQLIDKSQIKMPLIKSEDTALWWTILSSGVTAYGINENLVIYRRPSKSLSSGKVEALRRIWRLYRKIAGLNIFQAMFYFVIWTINTLKRRGFR